MVDMIHGRLIQNLVNSALHLMIGGGILLVNGQSNSWVRKLLYSSIRVVYWWGKNNHQKFTKTLIQTILLNCFTLYASICKHVLLRLELWPQCLKNLLESPKPNFLRCKGIPSHGCTRSGLQTRAYIHHLCENMRFRQEDLPEIMDDRDG